MKERYEIISLIGHGGTSMVYLAKDRKLDCYWAVKRINKKDLDLMNIRRREAKILSGLNHSDIPRIVDTIDTKQEYFVIMDYINGINLCKKIMKEGPSKEIDIIKWMQMICDVLIYLHTNQNGKIIFRDVKPDNMILTENGRVKLIDFGSADYLSNIVTNNSCNTGTVGYAAPEQYEGSRQLVDERSDIYSLGASMFYLATGVIPPKSRNNIRSIRLFQPKISKELEKIIIKSTNLNKKRRYTSVIALKKDLQNLQNIKERQHEKKKLVRKTIIIFVSFLVLVGITRMIYLYRKSLIIDEKNFRYHYQTAISMINEHDISEAANHFLKAISYQADNEDSYLGYFNALLMQSNDNQIENKKCAIDIMRNNYLENKKSKMHLNEKIMYQVMLKCLEVNDSMYAEYALKYAQRLKKSKKQYANLNYYEVIAKYCSKCIQTEDIDDLTEALDNIFYIADSAIQIEEKLKQYYLLLVVYSAYGSNIDNSYQRISDIGNNLKQIMENNQTEIQNKEEFLLMIEMISNSIYADAFCIEDCKERENRYIQCINWSNYIEEHHGTLSESLLLQKANAYKYIFELSEKNTQDLKNLNHAISIYKQVIEKDNASLIAYIFLVQALIEKELTTENRDFTEIRMYYTVIENKQKEECNMTGILSAQIQSLKQNMINAGINLN